MTPEVSEGLLYFLKYPLLILLYVFLACALRMMASALPTPKELAARPAPGARPTPPALPVRAVGSAQMGTSASLEAAPESLPPPARPPEWGRLEVIAGMDPPAGGIPIHGTLLFGRASDCPVRIPDPFVSSHHARLVPGSEGVVLEDLGSRNGTWLGPERLEGPVRLQDGDHFAVGDVTFRYHRT